MGLGGISVWQLMIVLLIVVLLFGTKKLKGMGSDLGDAIKGFKKAVNDDDDKADSTGSLEKTSTDKDAVNQDKKEKATADKKD